MNDMTKDRCEDKKIVLALDFGNPHNIDAIPDGYNSICIHLKADCMDNQLAKAIKQVLDDSIDAHKFFIDNFMMTDSPNDYKVLNI